MNHITLLLLSIFFSISLSAQNKDSAVICMDPMKQNFEEVVAKGCGLVLENTFLGRADGISCTIENDRVPYFGDNNAHLWSHVKAFTCDETLSNIERQRGMVRLRISETGEVESVDAMRFPSDVLAQRIESHFIQMDNWTPGRCADEPIPYNVDLVVTFAPQAD